MVIKKHHPWHLDYSEAAKLQKKLLLQIIKNDFIGPINRIAGVDIGYRKKSRSVTGAVLIFSYPGLELLEISISEHIIDFPYIPGLLAFREGPVIVKCFEKIQNMPDLVFFDGNGYMHPRRIGVASHIGILIDIPSIGCAKRKLCGDFKGDPKNRGEYRLVRDDGEIIGAAVVTSDNVKPIFVSLGYKICLKSAIKYTLDVSSFRIPEPIRRTHNFLREIID
jgi:deoxyribonuclease V